MKLKKIIQIADVLDDSRRMPKDMYDLDEHYYPSEYRGNLIKLADMDIVHLVRAFKKGVAKNANHVTDEQLVTQNDDLVNANKNLGDRVDYLTKGLQDGFVSGVNDLEKIEQLQMDNERLIQQLEHDERQVGNHADLIKERDEAIDESVSLSNTLEVYEEDYDTLTKANAELKFQIQQVDRNETVSKEAYDIAWDNMEYYKKKYTEVKDENNTVMDRNAVLSRMYNASLSNNPKGCGYMFSEIPNDTDGQEFVDTMKQYFNKKSYKMRVRGQHVKPEFKGKGVTAWGQNKSESSHMRVYIDVK